MCVCDRKKKKLKAGYNLQLVQGGKPVKTIRLNIPAQTHSLQSPQCPLQQRPAADRAQAARLAAMFTPVSGARQLWGTPAQRWHPQPKLTSR